MSRSIWKLPFVNKNLIHFSLYKKNKLQKSKSFLISDRSSIITKSLIGSKVKIYNGKKFLVIFLKQKMIGYKFGEFSITKIIGSKIAAKKREKQKKLLKKK